jgi:drug/metabolite transporter (DMT)-like permease
MRPIEADARDTARVRLTLVRVVLPAAMAVAGVVLIATGGEVGLGIGIVLIGSALLVVMANAMMRLSLQSERRRDEGRWED